MVIALFAIPILLEAYLSYQSVIEWHIRQVAYIHLFCAALFVLVAGIFNRFTVLVTDTEIVFGFGVFRKRISLDDIHATSLAEASFRTTGIGIHIVSGGYWAWVARTGPALRLTVGNNMAGGYILSSSRPRDLAAAIARTPLTPDE